MDRPNKAILTALLLAVLGVLGAVALIPGGLFIGKHEGDTLHLADIVLRMSRGQWPHLDFVTPIGVLAFWPISALVAAGMGVGHAILVAQVLVAIVLFPAIWWVSWSRFRGVAAGLFGGGVLVLVLAIVHGTSDPIVSISMHYNRWAWAVAFLVIATILLPNEGRARPAPDGLVIGLGLAVLALIKVTYFVALAPAVLVALAGRRAGMTFLWALAAGLAVAAVMTLAAGVAFWPAYLQDLLNVRASPLRERPGLPLAEVVSAPAYMAGSIVALLGVILLRQSGRALEGLVALLLLPGLVFITYQNFGNDPLWLGPLGLMLWVLAPRRDIYNALGWNLHQGLLLAAVAALALAAPSYTNLAWSPFRHLGFAGGEFWPLLPRAGVHEDVQVARIRARQVTAEVPADGPGTPFAAFADPDLRDPVRARFQGEDLPICKTRVGLVAWYMTLAEDLKAAGLTPGRTVFATDLISAFWLYGAAAPLAGAAPWYYGGLTGYEQADYLLVPLCPLFPKARKIITDELNARLAASGEALTEVRRNDLYILYRR